MTGAQEPIYRTGGTGVAWRETGQEIVVLDLSGSVYFGLNANAAVLWKELVSGSTRSRLVSSLLTVDAGARGRAERDVDDFLSRLDDAGLLLRD